jgi:hypothetical protein
VVTELCRCGSEFVLRALERFRGILRAAGCKWRVRVWMEANSGFCEAIWEMQEGNRGGCALRHLCEGKVRKKFPQRRVERNLRKQQGSIRCGFFYKALGVLLRFWGWRFPQVSEARSPPQRRRPVAGGPGRSGRHGKGKAIAGATAPVAAERWQFLLVWARRGRAGLRMRGGCRCGGGGGEIAARAMREGRRFRAVPRARSR